MSAAAGSEERFPLFPLFFGHGEWITIEGQALCLRNGRSGGAVSPGLPMPVREGFSGRFFSRSGRREIQISFSAFQAWHHAVRP